VLEACSASLKLNGNPIRFGDGKFFPALSPNGGNGHGNHWNGNGNGGNGGNGRNGDLKLSQKPALNRRRNLRGRHLATL